MNFIETSIKDLLILEPKIWQDGRGYFFESYNEKLFESNGIPFHFVQDNQSFSQKGALRGLHAQAPPFAQGKLVRVIKGSVIDVVVDIRTASATYGKVETVKLSGENNRMLWVPPGFLHGFITLEDETIFSYKVTNFYDKASEIGVIWNDSDLQIEWGMNVSDILLSEKDKELPAFREFSSPF